MISRLTFKDEDLGMFHLMHPPGIHNVRQRRLAAAAVALYLNVPSDLIREGTRVKFAGVGRRFDIEAAS